MYKHHSDRRKIGKSEIYLHKFAAKNNIIRLTSEPNQQLQEVHHNHVKQFSENQPIMDSSNLQVHQSERNTNLVQELF